MTKVTLGLGLVIGIGYIALAVIGLIVGVSDDGSDLTFWVGLLLGGGLLVLAGLFRVKPQGWLPVVLVTVGAAAGALAVWWSAVVPILALI